MTMGLVMKFSYGLPTNATVFTNPYATTEKRSALRNTRWDMYSVLEATVDRCDITLTDKSDTNLSISLL
jgi:hypothetical protein